MPTDTRRRWLRNGSAGLGVAALSPLLSCARPDAPTSRWSQEWDRAVLEASLATIRRQFNPDELMLRVELGPDYRYHTALRSQAAHPTRDSLHFAMLLLEGRNDTDDQLAFQIIERILALQDVDPDSKWYGIWGWYLEEPPPRMQPADWNWADFLGSILLLIHHRHGERLPEALRARVLIGIRHAAYSVRRRNVRMGYTNIAIKGTFVTLAAASLLQDSSLREYARDRLLRLTQEVDRTGSFNEYNSPTYNRVGIENLTRMRMVWTETDAAAVALRIEERMWDHFSRRWHAASRQLAGPISRTYSNDIGVALWLQKATDNRLSFASLAELQRGEAYGAPESSYIDFRCPSQFLDRFLAPGAPRLVREIFLPAESHPHPTQGSTWLSPQASIGSVNQGDFWVQRRPLITYWKLQQGGFGYGQLRVMKDDYDFSSALCFSVQNDAAVLAAISFRSPGGDRHISLEPIENGQFDASSLRLQFDISAEALPGPGVATPVAGSDARFRFHLRDDLELHFQVAGIRFGSNLEGIARCQVDAARNGETPRSTVTIELLPPSSSTEARRIRWQQVEHAWAVVAISLSNKGTSAASSADPVLAIADYTPATGILKAKWESPTGTLELSASGKAVSIEEHLSRFDGGRVRGAAITPQRLNENLLAAGFQP